MHERTGQLVQNKFKEYLIPSIFTSLAISLASVVDSMIVGKLLGDTALAAIGLSSPIVFCVNLIYLLFATGGLTCASIEIGKRNNEKANHIFTITILIGTFISLLFAIVAQFVMNPLALLLASGDAETAILIGQYMRPLVFVGVFIMLSSGMAIFIRADGRPKISAIIVLVANIVNLILDYIFIRFMNTGIMGAGLSTVLGYVAGLMLVVPYLFSKERTFKFVKFGKGFKNIFIDIIKTGLPKGLSQFTSLLRSIVLNAIIMATVGAAGMAVMTVCLNVYMISGIFIGGTSDALLPIVGTLYGDRDYYGVKKAIKAAAVVLTFACVGLLLFFMIKPELVGNWFGLTASEGVELLKVALRLYVLYLPFSCINMILQNFYTTTGRSKLASYISVFDGFVFVCAAAFLFSKVAPKLIWLSFACSGALTLVGLLILSKRVRKKEKVKGILLMREEQEKSVSKDITVRTSLEEIAKLTRETVVFLRANNVDEIISHRIGVVIEEMALNVHNLAHNKRKDGVIDILIRITNEEIFVRFRDSGKIFNPLEYKVEEDEFLTDGIEIAKKLATSVDYMRQLGFNTTIMSFARN